MTLATLNDELARHGKHYAFLQLMRRLRLSFDDEASFAAGVRVRPHLSLAFPDHDVAEVERRTDGVWQLTASFFGLYGTASPLPNFYTEDLLDEARNGESSMRDLLDVIHAALYPLLFRAWEKYRIWLAVAERRDAHALDRLNALIGLHGSARSRQDWRAGGYAGSAAGRQPRTDLKGDADQELLRFAGLFNRYPRSAAALQALCSGLLDGAPVEVVPCTPRTIAITPEAHAVLSARSGCLGQAVLGHSIIDRRGAVTLRVGPVSAPLFDALLPGQPRLKKLMRDLSRFLDRSLQCVLELWLEADARRGAVLGASGAGSGGVNVGVAIGDNSMHHATSQRSRLGFDCWLAADRSRVRHISPSLDDVPARFDLDLQAHAHLATHPSPAAQSHAFHDYLPVY
ncbi:MAG: type VI secretion system baseplate subunit TssG [Janthinobacterium lividum]